MTTRHLNSLSRLEKGQILKAHRGILSAAARACGRPRQTVNQVYWNERPRIPISEQARALIVAALEAEFDARHVFDLNGSVAEVAK